TGALCGRAKMRLAARATAVTEATVGSTVAAELVLAAEFTGEALQRVSVGQLGKATTAEVEREIALVIGRRGIGFDTDGNHGRGNGLNDVGEARNLRRLDGNGFCIAFGNARGDAGREHDGCKPCDGGRLQRGLEARTERGN